MKFFNKNLLTIIIVLFTYLNTYTITPESIIAAVENLTTSTSVSTSNSSSISTFDVTPYNLITETSTEKLIFQTVTHENTITLMADYHNKETGEIAHAEGQLYPDNSLSNENGLQFDLQLSSSNSDIPDISNASNTSQKHDYLGDKLKEDAIDSFRQETEYNHATQTHNAIKKQPKVIREQDLQKNRVYFRRDFEGVPLDSDLMLQKHNVIHDPRGALSSPIIAARIDRVVTFYTYKTNLNSNFQSELTFAKAFKSGKVLHLLNQIYDSNLPTAKEAFNELKKLWIRERKHMFLIHNSYNNRELTFIAELGIDIMTKAERALITRSDYIAEHTNEQSLKTIQKYKEYCTQLQKKGNRSALLDEIKKLRPTIKKRSDFATQISLAIAEKNFFDPATTALHEIAHASSLEKACIYVKNLELQLLTQAQQQNIVTANQMRTWTIEHYGFDLLDAAQSCYKSRADYVYTPDNQSYLSDTMTPILRNIESKDLPKAHAELINLEKQIDKALAKRNITDLGEQKELIVKNFGSDIIERAQKLYTNRSDHKHLSNAFIPIDVQSRSIDILTNHHDYASVGQEFDMLAGRVFDNARLCKLDYVPEVEAHVMYSLNVIRAPRNDAEFVFNVTIVDHVLTDIQSQVDGIVKGEPPALDRIPELFSRAVGKFINGLNPVTQVTNLCELVEGISLLSNKTLNIAVDAVDNPIDALHNALEINAKACDFLASTARFTSDLIIGDVYLSPEEYRQRADLFNNACASIITPENVVDLTAQIAADFVFFKGIPSAFIYLKEIDATSKLETQAAKIANKFKQAADTHLANNPTLVTAEGIALQISNDLKNVGGATKDSSLGQKIILRAANMQEFFDLPFGKSLIKNSQKTPYRFQHSPIYKITKDIPGTDLKKGYFYYLDRFHNDHIEVFDHACKCVNVYNLNGTTNTAKQIMAQENGRNIKNLMKGK